MQSVVWTPVCAHMRAGQLCCAIFAGFLVFKESNQRYCIQYHLVSIKAKHTASIRGRYWDMSITVQITETTMCKYAILPHQYKAVDVCSACFILRFICPQGLPLPVTALKSSRDHFMWLFSLGCLLMFDWCVDCVRCRMPGC